MSDKITQNATGTVRNQIGSKCFGFVTVDAADVFVHLDHLRKFGFTKAEFAPGAEMVLDFEAQPDGRFRVVTIHSLGGKPAGTQKPKNQGRRAPKRKRTTLAIGDIVVGRFGAGSDWDKGFGFAAVIALYEDEQLRRFGQAERPKDLFVHVTRSPEEFDEAVAAGELLELRVIEGRQAGQIAGEVMQIHEGELADEEMPEAATEEEVAVAA